MTQPSDPGQKASSHTVQPHEGNTQGDQGRAPGGETIDQAAVSDAKQVPLRTLNDLFTVKGATASRLLHELARGESWQFDAGEVRSICWRLDELDPDLRRTRSLVHEAIGYRDGQFAPAALEVAGGALRESLRGVPGWPPQNEDNLDPALILRAAAERLKPDLKGKRRRTTNALVMVIDSLGFRRGLSVEAVAPILRETLGEPKDYARGRHNKRLHRLRQLTEPRAEFERLRGFVDVLVPQLEDLEAAHVRADEEHRSRLSAEQQATETRQRMAEVVRQGEGVQAQLAEARKELEAAREELRQAGISDRGATSEIEARERRFLGGRLRGLLATAKEASEVDPPRPDVASMKLRQAIKEVEAEVEWLTSSD